MNLPQHNQNIDYASLIAIAAIFIFRSWGIGTIALPDYDSANNLFIIQDLWGDRLHDLYHHISPIFYVLMNVIYRITASTNSLLYASIAFSTAGLYFFATCAAPFPKHYRWVLILTMGTSPLLFYHARSLSIESLSFLSFCLLFKLIFTNSIHSNKRIFYTGIAYGLMLSINYKALLLIPLLIWSLLHIQSAKKGSIITKIIRTSIYLFAPFAILVCAYSLIGYFMGIGIDSYIGKFYGQAIVKDMNPEADIPSLRTDFDFYFRYLLDYESIIISLLSFLGLWIGWKKYSGKGPKLASIVQTPPLLAWGTYLFMVMLPFQKAPRALLFFLPFASYWGLSCLINMVRNIQLKLPKYKVQHFVIFSFLGIVLYQNINTLHSSHLLDMRSGYAPLIQHIHALNSNQVYAYKSIMPQIFDSDIIAINEVEELGKGDKISFLISDGYEYATNARKLDVTYFQEIGNGWFAPAIATPFLYLEHSEYTGLSYDETLHLWKENMALNQGKVKLYRIDTDNSRPTVR